MPRTFTLAEAQTLLPTLDSLLRQALARRQQVADIAAEFQQVAAHVFASGGCEVDVVSLSRRKAEREAAAQQLKDALAEIEALGVQVKDLDIGLLDFPCVVDGETILLCWKLGEDHISYWHGLEEGFKGRKPITDKIAKAGPGDRPN